MQEQTPAEKSFSYWRYGENVMEPLGPIGIITHQLQPSLADNINRKLREKRKAYVQEYPDLANYLGYMRKDYRIAVDLERFNSGEGRAALLDTVRGHDLFIITDVLNYGQYSYQFNQLEPLSPDEHYQDLCRLVASTHGLCRRVNVIMPYIYEGRRYTRVNRGSMDCALMLRQLFDLGISNFITFDAHDSRVANAVPRNNFENFKTTEQIIAKVLQTVPDLRVDKDHLMIISTSETGIRRAVYYASLLQVPLGTFYRIHNADGTVDMEFLGDNIEGRDCWIIDDMIDTGETVLRSAEYLKAHGANRCLASVSYALFSKGYEKMNQAYDFDIIHKVFGTSLIYQPRELRDMPWFEPVDMSANIATIIDAINHNASLSNLLTPAQRITEIVDEHNAELQRATEEE